MKQFVSFAFFVLLATASPGASGIEPQSADVIIYGATSAGIAAAMATSREGKSVLLLEPSRHLGGLTTGGLGSTDIGNKAAIGGIAREFYERISQYYAKPDAVKWKPSTEAGQRVEAETARDPIAEKTGRTTKWRFEPHAAMAIYKEMLREAKLDVLFAQRLATVKQQGHRIVEIVMENGRSFSGAMFIDATYEGDLMAMAGVSYTVGRESNSQYGETLNGVRAQTPFHQFKVAVDPYAAAGNASSGLLPLIQAGDGGKPGDGDKEVQAYNYRLCMTQVAENKVPWTEPVGYDEKNYELLARLIEAQVAAHKPLSVRDLMAPGTLPNGKTDTNNKGAFSTDFIGRNYDYPDGNYATRARIAKEHENYTRGFLYFLATNPRVPEKLRQEMNSWGLAKDEFEDTNNWPPQLYVREARRMVSDYVMTELECRWARIAPDGIGLGAYNMDSHNCQRIVKNGRVENEGDVEVPVRGPYPVSYRSIIPRKGECENLLVPVCLAATHIAYGSIRMEPVFMILGESSAVAATIAINDRVSVQKVAYNKLAPKLMAQGQIISNANFVTSAPTVPKMDMETLPGVVVDDTQAAVTGEWSRSTAIKPFVGDGYLYDNNSEKGEKRVRFTPTLPEAGRYEVRMVYSPQNNRASNVPVVIHYADGETTVTVNQKEPLKNNEPLLLGVFKFNAGSDGWVEVRNDGTDGHVIADAIQFVPAK